jgi:hypothetical protein
MKSMHVRTNIFSGETQNPLFETPLEAVNTAMNWYQTASSVVQNALVDPNALKLFMDFLPPADQ